MDINLIQADKLSPVPISRQIADCILVNVENGNIAPGDRLPTERDLAEALHVARGTVKSAYKKLEGLNLIKTRQGSGSFISSGDDSIQATRKNSADALVKKMIASLRSMGLSDSEIRQSINRSLRRNAKAELTAAIIYDSAEFLMNFKKQLSCLENITFSIFIMESVTEDLNPEKLLDGYDLIIVPTKLFEKALNAMPRFKDKIIEAAAAPGNETIIHITALDRASRIGILCRTSAFLEVVRQTLLSLGFQEENIFSFFEADYTTETYFPGGIDALISFRDAHIFTDERFAFRNNEFYRKGGKIITFEYQIDKGSFIYIKNKICGCPGA